MSNSQKLAKGMTFKKRKKIKSIFSQTLLQKQICTMTWFMNKYIAIVFFSTSFTFASLNLVALLRFVILLTNVPFFQGFVIFVTMCREALDDYRRYRRDKEANSQKFRKLTRDGMVPVPSSNIKVGDLIVVDKVSLFGMISALKRQCN